MKLYKNFEPVSNMSAEDEVEDWILAEAHRAFEVTAVHPDTGKSKKLDPEDLKEIIALLVELERVLRGKTQKPAGGFASKFREFGLDPAWYAEASARRWPLFIARRRSVERSGRTFQELMAVLQEAGRENLGLLEGRAGRGGFDGC